MSINPGLAALVKRKAQEVLANLTTHGVTEKNNASAVIAADHGLDAIERLGKICVALLENSRRKPPIVRNSVKVFFTRVAPTTHERLDDGPKDVSLGAEKKTWFEKINAAETWYWAYFDALTFGEQISLQGEV
ncbi:Hypothetical Protein FCC1311_081161 [Hondaea fermentalgiana]|uniref:Uncharacterized protein n=1 Tax=Hondaea fermentalgiana TaxID=2315210 RepID=A0A2R5GR43_9STRA|nr:Hypothetical Protein FCC1311_081161 [Hondaea fermentalgiana]|eukprot:GBG33320.1 Hypothetical Protein FCC1311_081161 [Hondaea fermentalgiana]